MILATEKGNIMLGGFQASPACHSDDCSVKMEMNMENYWNIVTR